MGRAGTGIGSTGLGRSAHGLALAIGIAALVGLQMPAHAVPARSSSPISAQISSQPPAQAALPQAGPGASPTGEARPLAAWVAFCQRYPGECASDLDGPARIALTARVWTSILSVNRRVNASLRAVTDQDHWGRPDLWDLAEDGSGDCEDFQLLKRRLLAEAGLPRRAMRMSVVIDEKGEGHAVLTLITDRGDFVLDNKTDAVLAWTATGYTFVKREGQDGPGWVSLGGPASPTVTANR